MAKDLTQAVIFIVEDDPDDCLLIEQAFSESDAHPRLLFFRNGRELLDHLKKLGLRANKMDTPRQGIILLDTTLPVVGGLATLKEIKKDEKLRRIPVIMLSHINEADWVIESYDRKASGFIRKPTKTGDFLHVIKALINYWFEVVELPSE